jgi:hypothetical protein
MTSASTGHTLSASLGHPSITRSQGTFGLEWNMTTFGSIPRVDGANEASNLVGRLARRRDEIEAVGLLLGILGILLVLVLTIGTTTPFGP